MNFWTWTFCNNKRARQPALLAPHKVITMKKLTHRHENKIWAASWQNQQNDCAPSKDSDQPGHPPSLIRVFAVHMKKAWVLGYPLSAQRRLWSSWMDAQADLSLHWVHSQFVGFVTRRLISSKTLTWRYTVARSHSLAVFIVLFFYFLELFILPFDVKYLR